MNEALEAAPRETRRANEISYEVSRARSPCLAAARDGPDLANVAEWLRSAVVERLLLAAALVAVAAVVALLLARRRPDGPTQAGWTVPAQLDRADFSDPDAPWLVLVFSSATCDTCAGVVRNAEALESPMVAVADVEVGVAKALHDRYGIDAVPTLVVADADGVVRASFVGPVNATDLWATVAELREPGSVPEGCDHGVGDHDG